MPLLIPDETLKAIGMTESEARIEIACRWFDAGKLPFGRAAAFAGVSELQFEEELERRELPPYRYTEEKFASDLRTLQQLERE